MCGIIGKIGSLPDEKMCLKARDALSHRGPDDKGIYYNKEEEIFLGHRRLSIIDLSKDGRQPMWSEDGRFAIIFNGEIYNYIELRNELEHSYSFKTRTDTEVLLAAYIVWGEKALSKLNGMFAFVIWDSRDKNLFAARDRLGIKPFYYSTKNGFSFASEIKGLLTLGTKARPDESIMYDYLAHGLYDHRRETFFEGVLKLEAGHYLTFKGNKLSTKKYWDLADISDRARDISEKDAVIKLLELFSDSIRLRLRSDVPVGINVSSGLDSQSILYFTEKNSKEKLDLFSMRSLDTEYDEGFFIEALLSGEQKKRWHTATLTPESSVKYLEKTLISQDEPFGGIPTAAYYQLAELEKERGVTVILEGQGGDELFAGYKYFLPENILKTLGEYSATVSQDTTTQINTKVLREEFLNTSEGRLRFPALFSSDLLNVQYRDLIHTKLPRVLRFNDRLSMAHGREYREPLLDYRFVEFVFFLPDDLKIRGEEQKYLLRRAMRDFVPEQTLGRQKKTFGAQQTPWFRRYLKDYIMEILQSELFGSRPYWDQEKVLKEAGEFFSGKGDNSFFIWQWINLELWLRHYID
jgi:asparagine synthase (glutamine-hydrolysing)